MDRSLQYSVEIDGKRFKIRDNCDYRIVLKVIDALNDPELNEREKIECALIIFYEDYKKISNPELAIQKMFEIISYDNDLEKNSNSPRLMDWAHDFKLMTPAINRLLGYSVRDPNKFTHWDDFVGAYMEIDDKSPYATVVSIRSKLAKGKPLDKWEQEYYQNNRERINLPLRLSAEEEEWLNSD